MSAHSPKHPSGPSLGRTFRKLPESRQAAILDAAARVFAATGYTQANVADVCTAAGISNGALYKYFGSKRGLFEAVARRMNSLILERSRRFTNTGSSIWVVLRQVLYEAVGFLRRRRDYFAIYMELGSPSMNSFAPVLSDEVEGWAMEFFGAIVDRAKEAGEVRRDVDTRTAAHILDNSLMLFSFALVSEHYKRRLQKYLGRGRGTLSNRQKADRLVRSCKQLLGRL